jgi:hypothetical protein
VLIVVAIIASLTNLTDTVTAARLGAVVQAAVSWVGVPIVTRFAVVHDAIAAAWRRAQPRAEIIVDRVAVVTPLKIRVVLWQVTTNNSVTAASQQAAVRALIAALDVSVITPLITKDARL